MATTLDAMLVQTPDICGGRIRLEGTRLTVHRLATLYRQGMTAEEIGQTYPQLTLGQVYLALAYYHAHRQEIDAELATDDAHYEQLKNRAAGNDGT